MEHRTGHECELVDWTSYNNHLTFDMWTLIPWSGQDYG